MPQTNDPNTPQSSGSHGEVKPLTTTSINTELVEFLANLPSLNLSTARRIAVCKRFGVTNDELTAALAVGAVIKRQELFPILAKEFGADALFCAMVLTGTMRPTPAQLDAALLKMYPVGGPTAASLVAAGWLLLITDKELLSGVVEITQQPEPGK